MAGPACHTAPARLQVRNRRIRQLTERSFHPAGAMILPALQPSLPSPPVAPCRPSQRLQAHAAVAAAAADRSWPCSSRQLAAAPGRRRQRQRHRLCLRALQVEAPSEAMGVEAAWALLEDFTAKEARGLAQPFLNDRASRQRLRDALLVAAAAPHVPAGWNPSSSGSGGGDSSSSSGDSNRSSSGGSGGVPEVLLGVLASDVRLAVRALRDYTQALGLPSLVSERELARAPEGLHAAGRHTLVAGGWPVKGHWLPPGPCAGAGEPRAGRCGGARHPRPGVHQGACRQLAGQVSICASQLGAASPACASFQHPTPNPCATAPACLPARPPPCSTTRPPGCATPAATRGGTGACWCSWGSASWATCRWACLMKPWQSRHRRWAEGALTAALAVTRGCCAAASRQVQAGRAGDGQGDQARACASLGSTRSRARRCVVPAALPGCRPWHFVSWLRLGAQTDCYRFTIYLPAI